VNSEFVEVKFRDGHLETRRDKRYCGLRIDHEHLDYVVGAGGIDALDLDVDFVDQVGQHEWKLWRLTPLSVDVVFEVEAHVGIEHWLLRQVLQLQLDPEDGSDALISGLESDLCALCVRHRSKAVTQESQVCLRRLEPQPTKILLELLVHLRAMFSLSLGEFDEKRGLLGHL